MRRAFRVMTPRLKLFNGGTSRKFVQLTSNFLIMILLPSLKLLASAPDVQRKLRRSLLVALEDSPGDRPLTYADVAFPEKTPYLEAVLSEALRCGRVAIAGAKACA